MNFEKGKWYTNSDWEDNSFTKFSYQLNDQFYFTECINNNTYIEKDDWWIIGRKYRFKLVDLSEIQQYLPPNHPDKEFILPKNWYVIVTKENQDKVSEWRFENKTYRVDIGKLCGYSTGTQGMEGKGHNPANEPKGDSYDFGKEITFEQFKKYVLKEESSNDDYSYLIKLLKNITK